MRWGREAGGLRGRGCMGRGVFIEALDCLSTLTVLRLLILYELRVAMDPMRQFGGARKWSHYQRCGWDTCLLQ